MMSNIYLSVKHQFGTYSRKKVTFLYTLCKEKFVLGHFRLCALLLESKFH